MKQTKLGPFTGLIFDQDGTILDAELGHCNSWIKVAAHHKVTFGEETFKRFAGMGDTAIGKFVAKEINPTLSADGDEVLKEGLALKEEKREVYKHLVDDLPLMPGAKNLLTKAKQLDVPMAIATISPSRETQQTVKNHGLDKFFSVIVTIDDMDHPDRTKPAPDIYLAAARKLNLNPAHCLAFEDSLTGVQAALNANMQVIAVPTQYSAHFDYSSATIVAKSLQSVGLIRADSKIFALITKNAR